MNSQSPNRSYRFTKHYRREQIPNGYRYTLCAIDEASGQSLAECDVTGRPSQTTLVITDAGHGIWSMAPNRRLMPTRWTLTDPAQRVAVQMDQKILGKLVNPLYTVVFTLLDGHGEEIARLIDPRKSIPDRMFGLGPDEWALVAGERLMAKLVRLSRTKVPAHGLLGGLKAMLAGSDHGITSMGGEHAFPAPVALAMLMLFLELTDVSGGA